MTRSASSGRSLYQLQNRRAAVVILVLLFSVVRVDAYFRGVRTRDGGVSYSCQVQSVDVAPRNKIWLGTHRTEELAALACDVGFFYTRKTYAINLEYSESLIKEKCKPMSAYDTLKGWEERTNFIKAEASALVNFMSSQNDGTDFRGEDIVPPPIIPAHHIPFDVAPLASTIVQHFRNQAHQLRDFMGWFMRYFSLDSTQSTHQGHVQTDMQQPSVETVSQSDAEEAPPVEDDQFLDNEFFGDLFLDDEFLDDEFLDEASIGLYLTSFEAQPNGHLWLNFLAIILPMLLKEYPSNHAHDNEDPSSTTNEASITEQERDQSSTERARKRQNDNQPSSSTNLDPEREDLFSMTPLNVKFREWQITGYDMGSKKWKKLPPFSFLPDQDPASFKKYSICGHGMLMCVNISTVGADLVVFNPLTGKKRPLPPLLFPRHLVLLHMFVDSATKSYRVIVAGSTRLDEEHLSKKMEMFDSKTSKWEEMPDIPGPEFGLNDYQSGVCANGVLYFFSFLEGGGGKGVVAFDVENGKWLPTRTRAIPLFHSFKIFHLVENDGELYLFYELNGKHCIDVLELLNSASEEESCRWRTVVSVNCGRRFQGNPEYMCVSFGEGKLCIFDTVKGGAVVCDMRIRMASEVLESFREQRFVYYALNRLHPFLH